MADEAEIEARRRRIEEALAADACANCLKPLGDGERVGTGRFRDGVFCGLECQAKFHEDYYRERARASNPSRN